jgi:hypothetical protein
VVNGERILYIKVFEEMSVNLGANFILLIIGLLVMTTKAQIPCKQLEFNQRVLNGITNCKWIQQFQIKSYKDAAKKQFPPYKNTSEYYLSNQWEGLTCGETKDVFKLNTSSEILLTYNMFYYEGARLVIKLFDLDQLDSAKEAKAVENYTISQGTNGLWTTHKISVPKEIERAKVSL